LGNCSQNYDADKLTPFVFVQDSTYVKGLWVCNPSVPLTPLHTYRFTLDWYQGAENTQFYVQDITGGGLTQYADFQTYMAKSGYTNFQIFGQSSVTNANPATLPAVWIGGLGESNAVQQTWLRFSSSQITTLTWNNGNPNGTGIDDSTCNGISIYQKFEANPPAQPYNSEVDEAAYEWVKNWTIEYDDNVVSPPTGPSPTPPPAPSNPLPPDAPYTSESQPAPTPGGTPTPSPTPSSGSATPALPAMTATPIVGATAPPNPLPPDARLTPTSGASHAP